MTTNLPTLYQLTDDYLQAFQRLQEADLPEEALRDTLEGLQYPLEQKSTAVAQMARNMEALAAQIKAAEQDMDTRRNAIEDRAARLRAYLKDCMEKAGMTKIDSPWFTLSIKKNPPALEVAPGAAIPDRWKRIPPIPEPELDKAAIKEALKAGELIDGCRLVQSTRLDIK